MNDTTRRMPRTLSGSEGAFRDAAYGDQLRHYKNSSLRAAVWRWIRAILNA